MSILSELLKKAGVPKSLLDDAQVLIDGYKDKLQEKLPTTEAICLSIKAQPAFKAEYKKLPAEIQAYVDSLLPVIVDCAVVKIRKVLGI
jgi:hypothetical protein